MCEHFDDFEKLHVLFKRIIYFGAVLQQRLYLTNLHDMNNNSLVQHAQYLVDC